MAVQTLVSMKNAKRGRVLLRGELVAENLLFGQRGYDADIIDGEVTRFAVEATVVPVVVHLAFQHDDVALFDDLADGLAGSNQWFEIGVF